MSRKKVITVFSNTVFTHERPTELPFKMFSGRLILLCFHSVDFFINLFWQISQKKLGGDFLFYPVQVLSAQDVQSGETIPALRNPEAVFMFCPLALNVPHVTTLLQTPISALDRRVALLSPPVVFMALMVDVEFTGSLLLSLFFFLTRCAHLPHTSHSFTSLGQKLQGKRGLCSMQFLKLCSLISWGLPAATTRKCFLLISTSHTFQATSSHMPASLTLSYHLPTAGKQTLTLNEQPCLWWVKPFTEPQRAPPPRIEGRYLVP